MWSDQAAYPQWYPGFRGLVLGTGFGMVLMWNLIVGKFFVVDRLISQLIVTTVINASILTLLGTLEVYFAIQRYRRLRGDR